MKQIALLLTLSGCGIQAPISGQGQAQAAIAAPVQVVTISVICGPSDHEVEQIIDVPVSDPNTLIGNILNQNELEPLR